MNKLINYQLVIILSTVFCFNSCSDENISVSPKGKEFSTEIVTKLDNAFNDAMKKYEIPGAIVGIWSPEGNYLQANGFPIWLIMNR